MTLLPRFGYGVARTAPKRRTITMGIDTKALVYVTLIVVAAAIIVAAFG